MNNQERNQVRKLLASAAADMGMSVTRVPEEILTLSVRWQLFKHYMYQLPTDTSLLIGFAELAPILLEINQRTLDYSFKYLEEQKALPSTVTLDAFSKSVYEELQANKRAGGAK